MSKAALFVLALILWWAIGQVGISIMGPVETPWPGHPNGHIIRTYYGGWTDSWEQTVWFYGGLTLLSYLAGYLFIFKGFHERKRHGTAKSGKDPINPGMGR